jgi:hypothetical protein
MQRVNWVFLIAGATRLKHERNEGFKASRAIRKAQFTQKRVTYKIVLFEPCGATGQRRDRSLPRPTWLPDGRSWVNSSSMSELGIVCRRLRVGRCGDSMFRAV